MLGAIGSASVYLARAVPPSRAPTTPTCAPTRSASRRTSADRSSSSPIVDNQRVEQGDLLFVVDPRPYQAALDKARAQLELTNLEIRGYEHAIGAAEALLEQREADAAYAEQYRRPRRAAARAQVRDAERRLPGRVARRSPPRRRCRRRASVPSRARNNPLKLRQIAAFGAAVRIEGEDIEDARLLAREIAEADGAYLVEDSLDLATCEGAATMGLELVRDDPSLDVVLVALGGGAMASGVGYAMRSLAGHVEVIGIQPHGAPAMALSWRKRAVVETDRIETIADGVAGRCPIPEVLDDLLVVLDDVVLVGEDSIKAGMRAIYEHAGLVVEPSAALGIAAVLEQPERFAGRRVTTILCGSNVCPADFARWVLEPALQDTN